MANTDIAYKALERFFNLKDPLKVDFEKAPFFTFKAIVHSLTTTHVGNFFKAKKKFYKVGIQIEEELDVTNLPDQVITLYFEFHGKSYFLNGIVESAKKTTPTLITALFEPKNINLRKKRIYIRFNNPFRKSSLNQNIVLKDISIDGLKLIFNSIQAFKNEDILTILLKVPHKITANNDVMWDLMKVKVNISITHQMKVKQKHYVGGQFLELNPSVLSVIQKFIVLIQRAENVKQVKGYLPNIPSIEVEQVSTNPV